MDLSLTHFIGIDLSAGRGGVTLAVLDGVKRILFRGMVTPFELEHQLAGSSISIAAITSPISLNEGLMADADYRSGLKHPPSGNRQTNLRVCEYELLRMGFTSNRTPGQAADCKPSLQRALRFASELAGRGFERWPSPGSERQLMETNADACFAALLSVKSFPATSLEGRIQRQLILAEHISEIPDAMVFFEEVTRHRLLSGRLPENILLSASELNALAAAFTARLAYTDPESITRLGDPTEGRIILPVTRPSV